MKDRLGDILYGAGLVAAAICLLYAVDVVWVHESGRSLLGITGRFISQEDVSAGIIISIILAGVSWGVGAAARSYVNKSAAKRAAEASSKLTDK